MTRGAHIAAQVGDAPCVLVEKQKGALRIAACDARALRQGIGEGATLADARARVPGLFAALMDRDADARHLLDAAGLCEMFTPLVALREPAGLLLDITGCAHLFGGEAEMLRRLRRRLAGFGLASRGVVSGTPESAWAVARFGEASIVPPGQEEAMAGPLPVASLEQDGATTLALTRAGLTRLADLAARPASMLVSRFGTALVARLHGILGHEDRRITALRPPPDYLAEAHFAEPLATIEPLLAVLEKLAADLAAMLERHARGGRSFEVSLFRVDGKVRRLRLETAMPLRDVAGLMRLIRLRIETLGDPLDPGFGFDALRLAVTQSELMEDRQGRLSGETEREERSVSDLLDRLVTRFGRENVGRFILRDTHDPARAGACAALFAATPMGGFPALAPEEPPMRPLTLFAHPQPVEALAEVPDGPPLRFRWRRILHEVTRAEGPERIAPEWWSHGQGAPTRDYYRVEDQAGHRFWLFREGLFHEGNGLPRWFLHGLFA